MPANWEELRDRERAKRAVDPCAQQPEGGCIMAPVKVRDVKPRFPLSLKGSKIDENVVLKGIVGADGSLRDLQVVGSPHPDLVAAAMDAVSQWLFEPTRLDGIVVETSITITVNFAGR